MNASDFILADAVAATPWIALLLGVHTLVRFSTSALLNARRGTLRERAEHGDHRAARVLAVVANQGRVLISADILLMIVRFTLAAFVVIDYGRVITLFDESVGVYLPPQIGSILALIPAILITYFVCDLMASALGRTYADQAAPFVAWTARVLMTVLRPLVALAIGIDRLISRRGGEIINKAVTEEEIIALVEEGQESGTIEDEEKEMIHSVLQFGETLAREVMIPRQDIEGVEVSESLPSALKLIVESGHSRIPVYEETIDVIRGVLYAKDLLTIANKGALGGATATQSTVRALMRPAYFVPETKRADMLFREMQARKTHIALIVDEYGGTAGLVTIEDLIEEIVGDIRDEYDANETEEYTLHGEHAYLLDGAMNLDDVNELLDTELADEENDSIGGYVYTVLGRVPEVGDVIENAETGLFLRIEAVENRRIRKIYAERRMPEPESGRTAEVTTSRTQEPAAARTGEVAVSQPDAPPQPSEAAVQAANSTDEA